MHLSTQGSAWGSEMSVNMAQQTTHVELDILTSPHYGLQDAAESVKSEQWFVIKFLINWRWTNHWESTFPYVQQKIDP